MTEILDMLVAMDDVEYEHCRHAKAREWGMRLSTLDRIRKHAKLRQEYAQQTQQPELDADEMKHRLAYIWESEDILDLWLQSWDKVMAGEHRNAKLLYLIATSRLFDSCMHVAIKGPSSGGKSEIRRQVLEFFPPEDIVTFTTMSERALLYHKGDFDHKILSMAEAHGFEEQQMQDMLLRELMSEGKLIYRSCRRSPVSSSRPIIIKNGPVCFMVTTTKAALHPENETRMISLEIDDSEEQTRRVLKKLAQTTGKNLRPDDSIHYDWQDFQRLLHKIGNKNVVVPFADALATLIPPRATRLRRDFSQIIACIKSHALIHCCRRMNNEKGELVADLDLDYVPVAELIGHITAEGAGIAVSPRAAGDHRRGEDHHGEYPCRRRRDGFRGRQEAGSGQVDGAASSAGCGRERASSSILKSTEVGPENTGSPTRKSRPSRCCRRRTRSGRRWRTWRFNLLLPQMGSEIDATAQPQPIS